MKPIHWLSAILLILALFACSAFLQWSEAKITEDENKAVYVEIKSVGVWHRYQVDNVNVVLVEENIND